MLTNVIFRAFQPGLNRFPSNKEQFSKKYNLMTEETSIFENLLSKMKSSKFTKTAGCSNANCKVPFAILGKCHFCGKKFCTGCQVKCEKCEEFFCKFCIAIRYEKYADVYLCPNCINQD